MYHDHSADVLAHAYHGKTASTSPGHIKIPTSSPPFCFCLQNSLHIRSRHQGLRSSDQSAANSPNFSHQHTTPNVTQPECLPTWTTTTQANNYLNSSRPSSW